MSASGAEAPGWPPGMREAWESGGVISAAAPAPRLPARQSVCPQHKPRFPLTKSLPSLAACLSTLFAVSLALEAFDADLTLWPLGTEDFTASQDSHLVRGAQGAGAFPPLRVAYGFVMTAGALLVVRYRARSALATDAPSVTVMLSTTAEPWGPHNDCRPGARPLCFGARARMVGRLGRGTSTPADASVRLSR